MRPATAGDRDVYYRALRGADPGPPPRVEEPTMVSRIAFALLVGGFSGSALERAAPQAAPAAPAAAGAKDGKDAKPESTGKVGEKIPAFTAKALRGDKEFDFDSGKQSKITVYFLAGVTCTATNAYAERLAALCEAYGPKGVDFVFLYPNKNESAADKRKFQKEKRLGGAFLNDVDAAIAKKLAAKRTGEALLCDKDGRVLYRGGIDDNLNEPARAKVKYVAQALDETLAGKSVSVTTGKVFGETIRQ
jgi:hypothetical protein